MLAWVYPPPPDHITSAVLFGVRLHLIACLMFSRGGIYKELIRLVLRVVFTRTNAIQAFTSYWLSLGLSHAICPPLFRILAAAPNPGADHF